MDTEMSEGDEDPQVNESELSSVVLSLTRSQEAMSTLGSAVANQVLEAMRSGGPGNGAGGGTSSSYIGDQPAISSARERQASAAHALGHGGCFAPPPAPPYMMTGYPPPPGLAWPYQWPPSGWGHCSRDPSFQAQQVGSPFDRLGPPQTSHDSGGTTSEFSSRNGSGRSDSGSEDNLEESDDFLSIHPEKDGSLDPEQDPIMDSVRDLVLESIRAPLSNQDRKKNLGKYSQPSIEELRPPHLDTTLKILVSKGISAHDAWLQKVQALCLDAYAPMVSLLNQQAKGFSPSHEELQSVLQCSMRLMGNVFARLNQERRRKVLTGISKDLAHMADEPFDSSRALFGDKAVDKIKNRHEALKTLRSVKQPFRKGGAQRSNRPGRRDFQVPHQNQFRSGVRKSKFIPQHKNPQFQQQKKN